jgi:MerR family transcriptional regulator, light-induced transcriptional regulator
MGAYRIKAVSHMTGIRPELLRMWEKRYRLFKPQRSGNRYREFDDEDVHLLLYLRQQIEQGRAIGELAGEGREALLRQMASAESSQVQGQEELSTLINELLDDVCRLDKRHLDARLAACGVFYPFTTLLTAVVTPLMHRLGDQWAAGEASIVSGHFAAMVLKQRVLSMLQATAWRSDAPILLCACPTGEFHELGLLTFAYTMQQEGWQVYYLGVNLPVSALLEACQQVQPALVALSLTHAAEPASRLDALQEIDVGIARTYPTCVGGQAIARYQQSLQPRHMTLCSTFSVAQEYGRKVVATTQPAAG